VYSISSGHDDILELFYVSCNNFQVLAYFQVLTYYIYLTFINLAPTPAPFGATAAAFGQPAAAPSLFGGGAKPAGK